MYHSFSPFEVREKPASYCGHMAQPGRVSSPVVPFQRLRLAKFSPKVWTAVVDKCVGSIAMRFPPCRDLGYPKRLCDPVDVSPTIGSVRNSAKLQYFASHARR